MLNFQLLKLFIRIADAGSIAAAARALDISPSIASRQLAILERAFSTRLFVRTTRYLALTESGERLLDWAREAVEGYETISDELNAIEKRPSGIVRLACNDYAALHLLPEVLSRFSATYPEIRLVLQMSNEPASFLASGCDLALHAGRMPDSNLAGRRLRVYERVLCATPGYLARMGTPAEVTDLAHHHCLVQTTSERLHWCFEHRERIIEQKIDAHVEVDSFVVLRQLAFQGVGIIRVSRELVQREIDRGELAVLLPGYRCVYADGSLPALWLLIADRKLPHRSRLLADMIARALAT